MSNKRSISNAEALWEGTKRAFGFASHALSNDEITYDEYKSLMKRINKAIPLIETHRAKFGLL